MEGILEPQLASSNSSPVQLCSVSLFDQRPTTSAIPIELLSPIVHYALDSDIVWFSRSKAAWRSIQGLANASTTCRAVVMSSWFSKITLLTWDDWQRFLDPRAGSLLKYIRCGSFTLLSCTDHLVLFAQLPSLVHASCSFQLERCPSSSMAYLVQPPLHHLPPSLTELTVSGIVLEPLILGCISYRFPLLRMLSLVDLDSDSYIFMTSYSDLEFGKWLALELNSLKYLHTLQLGMILVRDGFVKHFEFHLHPVDPPSAQAWKEHYPVKLSMSPDCCPECQELSKESTLKCEQEAASILSSKLPSLRVVKWRTWSDGCVERHSVYNVDLSSDSYRWKRIGEEPALSPMQRFTSFL